jgi:hypothetical protein
MTPLTLLEPDLAFRLASTLALAGWVALALSPPRARWTPWVWRIAGYALPLVLSALYVALLAVHYRGQGGFNSLDEVRALFAVPGALAAGWIHYLAFDLFVGTWIAERCAQEGRSHAWVVPFLLMTFLFGPLGLLAYALLRSVRPSTRLPSPSPGASA